MVGATWARERAVSVADTERGLAEMAIVLLRANHVSDEDIRREYTNPDNAYNDYERRYLRDHGVKIAASRVKAHITRLLTQ